MQAVVQERYGPPELLRMEELDRPVPGDGEVLVKVRAASVNALDAHQMSGRPALARLVLGLRRPKRKVPGVDVAGTIEAVGPGVSGRSRGEEVFGTARGTFAEYALAPQGCVVPRPPNLSAEQAAAVPIAAFTALEALRDHARLARDERVLIHGAGGGVGTFAVQLARWMGAHVTATTSPAKCDAVRALGAEVVIDHTRQDVFAGQERFDAIVDLGSTRSIGTCRHLLTPSGRYVMIGATRLTSFGLIGRMTRARLSNRLHRQKTFTFVAKGADADLELLRTLLADGTIVATVARTYSLTDAAAALRHLTDERPLGKVVVRVAGD